VTGGIQVCKLSTWQRSDKIALAALILAGVALASNYRDLRALFREFRPVHRLTVTASSFRPAYYGPDTFLSADLAFHNAGSCDEIITEVRFILPVRPPFATEKGTFWPNVTPRILQNLQLQPGATLYYLLEQPMPMDALVAHALPAGRPSDDQERGQLVALRVVALRPDGFQLYHDVPLARFYPALQGGYDISFLNPGPVEFFGVAHEYSAGVKLAPAKPEVQNE
jgi:hypothetical protein